MLHKNLKSWIFLLKCWHLETGATAASKCSTDTDNKVLFCELFLSFVLFDSPFCSVQSFSIEPFEELDLVTARNVHFNLIKKTVSLSHQFTKRTCDVADCGICGLNKMTEGRRTKTSICGSAKGTDFLCAYWLSNVHQPCSVGGCKSCYLLFIMKYKLMGKKSWLNKI